MPRAKALGNYYICTCIYLPYIIPYIPVFYFNNLQIWTVHAHTLCIMLHREIKKGELRRHKNEEWQSYSDKVPSWSSGVGSSPSLAAMAAPLSADRDHNHQCAMHAWITTSMRVHSCSHHLNWWLFPSAMHMRSPTLWQWIASNACDNT